MEDYKAINKAFWNDRVSKHMDSDFYRLPEFIEGESSLRQIELDILPELAGKSLLHLQCHFGQDTLSLSRMGAKCTGIDLSDEAINAARALSNRIGEDAQFICTDLYEVPKKLKQEFDVVYTTYGTIGWLPDLSKWAEVVATMLKPGGELIFVEFHPFIWMFDDDIEKVVYSYFNHEAIVEENPGSYASKDAKVNKTVGWNHDLAEVISALLASGLQVESFQEYDFSPYSIFPDMEEDKPGEYVLSKWPRKVPLTYSLIARKPV